MKIETLKSRKRKYFLYVLVVGVGLLLILNLTTSKAKYKTVESIPIVKGTIKNYSPYDFKLIAVKIENESGEYETTDTIPTSGYMINMENSYCTIPDGNGNNVKDDSITIEYIDGQINFLGISKRNTKCTLYFNINREPTNFDYTGDVQTFIADLTGNYQIELWGAEGGSYTWSDGFVGGKGAYTSGIVRLFGGEKLYIYIGGYVTDNNEVSLGGYNGGGLTSTQSYNNAYTTAGGGGATDVRCFYNETFNTCGENINNLIWNDSLGLKSRIMISGGGGGTGGYYLTERGAAGGLIGYSGALGKHESSSSYPSYTATGGTQTTAGNSNGDFGIGGRPTTNRINGGPGGGGYYGGGAGGGGWAASGSGAGGSYFISGHTGCVAIKSSTDITPKDGCTTGTTDNACSIHYSGKTFTDTLMIDGEGYSWTNVKGDQVQMPNPQGGYYDLGVGHTGNGYARITYLGK